MYALQKWPIEWMKYTERKGYEVLKISGENE